ncbi:Tigger transposable element-derived protein 2 [Araneus ventricosus]|uniref:Tigger transposable element-derived protein 2 n=1 Tax=Araneus ventricosus TaxID=182803 RepID=A0A4Y2IVJ0_ARAVE|nr:Tigger transposable element-derived protein 2 [Araneus ventricosus]
MEKRHGIHVLSISGGKLSSNPEEATNFFKKFEDLVKEKALSIQQIYNVDETDLYYRILPTKTLASRKEVAAPGYKRNKDRVTVSLCGNASGTHKLPVILIGKSVKPRVFKNITVKSLPVHYTPSKTVWMNQDLLIEWFHSEFVPSAKKHLKSQKLPIKALLLLDIAPFPPSEDELKDDNIQSVFFPPNVKALIQPMDQGVIESVNRKYRRKLLTDLSEEDGKNISVIDLLKQINVKEVVYMIDESWSVEATGIHASEVVAKYLVTKSNQ